MPPIHWRGIRSIQEHGRAEQTSCAVILRGSAASRALEPASNELSSVKATENHEIGTCLRIIIVSCTKLGVKGYICGNEAF
jgi:hypothetical protein